MIIYRIWPKTQTFPDSYYNLLFEKEICRSCVLSKMTSSNTPSSINVHKKSAVLELIYKNGRSHHLPAEYLRVFSPSAEVQGHSPEQAILQHGKKNVQFLDIQAQGHYAVKISFSDGHDSGIYSWDYLFDLGKNYNKNWGKYLADLKSAGKSRDTQFISLSQ